MAKVRYSSSSKSQVCTHLFIELEKLSSHHNMYSCEGNKYCMVHTAIDEKNKNKT